ncbi:F-box/LRR-repeat protein At4g14096-like [Vigna radiata var. radiata]|uniref:F-box/LRR-repeat protein At4g14096-like n=1 Tax=Vigna radiata var. radiata TaxID=3916 RepID=A0A1S3V0B4_VIGRR|nr:F-box/LRR-repeat protein At4g14096-like [Vigna radiata var. radiata]
MVDLISSLPDEIICYILSFFPSQQVAATSVLSKRWNLLWHYVPSLDFDTAIEHFWRLNRQKTFYTFFRSVCFFLVGRGDQPFYRIHLKCYSSNDITESIPTRIRTALSESCRVQILNLLCRQWRGIVIPSVVFSFKTLVALMLECITVEDISFVDLPLLKILKLNIIISSIKIDLNPIKIDLSHLLSGGPNLEDLKLRLLPCEAKGKFNRLPNLVRAKINVLLPLEIFKDVKVLKFDLFRYPNLNLNFDFHNLVQLHLDVDMDWLLGNRPRLLRESRHIPPATSDIPQKAVGGF